MNGGLDDVVEGDVHIQESGFRGRDVPCETQRGVCVEALEERVKRVCPMTPDDEYVIYVSHPAERLKGLRVEELSF